MAERNAILELTDTELEQERRINNESKTQPPSVNSDSQPQPRGDLVHTFNLSRTYLDQKLVKSLTLFQKRILYLKSSEKKLI